MKMKFGWFTFWKNKGSIGLLTEDINHEREITVGWLQFFSSLKLIFTFLECSLFNKSKQWHHKILWNTTEWRRKYEQHGIEVCWKERKKEAQKNQCSYEWKWIKKKEKERIFFFIQCVFLYSGVYPTNSRCVSHQSQCIPLSTTFCNLSTLLETKLQQFNKHVLYLLSTSIHVYLKFQLNKIEYLHHRCGFQIWGTHRDGVHTGKKRYESGFL